MLLSFFIITCEHRQDRIRNIILKNKDNLVGIMMEFQEKRNEAGEADSIKLMEILVSRLENIEE